jgi:16S rRNA (guanine527-N7)-methyltransferase
VNANDEVRDAVAAGLARFGLDPGLGPQMLCLAEQSVSAEISSGTAVSSTREAVNVHIFDSLAAIETGWLVQATKLIDIGSGLGFPGLALAAAHPGLEVVLLDAARKKSDASALIARRCGVTNAFAVWGRAEEIGAAESDHRGRYDVVSARALAPLGVIAEYAAPLLRLGGVVVAWKGRLDEAELAAADAACEELGFEPGEPHTYEPYANSGRRTLWIARKAAPTPQRFPRRPGQAARSPLAG